MDKNKHLSSNDRSIIQKGSLKGTHLSGWQERWTRIHQLFLKKLETIFALRKKVLMVSPSTIVYFVLNALLSICVIILVATDFVSSVKPIPVQRLVQITSKRFVLSFQSRHMSAMGVKQEITAP